MMMIAMKMKMWRTCMPTRVGSKVNDIWLLVSMALLGIILGHVLNSLSMYLFSDTGFQACFRLGRAATRLCESPHPD